MWATREATKSIHIYVCVCVFIYIYVVVVQLPSHVQLFAIPWTTAHQASLSLTSHRVFQVHVHCFGDAIQPTHRLIPSSPSALNLSSIRWPKYWSFSFSISPSSKYSGLISLKIDWFDFLAVQGTLRSLLQHHSLNALILRHSTFFMVQLSQLYMTTGKTIALTMWTFVGE